MANGHQPWLPVRQYAPAGSADIRHVVLFGARVVLAYMDTNTTFQLLVGAAAGPGQVRQVARTFVSVPTTPEIDSDGSLRTFRRLTLDPAAARCVSNSSDSGLHNVKVLCCIQHLSRFSCMCREALNFTRAMDVARIGDITFVSVASAASGYILVLSTHGAILSVIHPTSPDPVGTYVVTLSLLFLLLLTLALLFLTGVVHSRPHVHVWTEKLGYYTCRDSELG